ncbi:MAG: hypothetical protein GY938_30840 [Ketobacter sp.]|nr:hypothetical protein [Ketobacter sp.]
MAAACTTSIMVDVSDLGENPPFAHKSSITATPTKPVSLRQIQAVANTDEAVNLGGVSTVERLSIICVSNDVDVDLNYSSSFSADFTIPEGESISITKPVGTTRIKNNDSDEAVTIDVHIVGSA